MMIIQHLREQSVSLSTSSCAVLSSPYTVDLLTAAVRHRPLLLVTFRDIGFDVKNIVLKKIKKFYENWNENLEKIAFNYFVHDKRFFLCLMWTIIWFIWSPYKLLINDLGGEKNKSSFCIPFFCLFLTHSTKQNQP